MEASNSPTPPPSKKKRVALSGLLDPSNDVTSRGVFSTGAPADEECGVEDPHPQVTTPYTSAVYQFLRSKEMEPERRPLSEYMRTIQTEVTAHMSGVLIDWLVKVADRNYNETTPRRVKDFCHLTKNNYTKQEFMKMESEMLKFLKFDAGGLTITSYLRRFIKAGQEYCKRNNLLLKFLACYIAELSLLDYGCIKFLPSVVAASAVYLARFTVDPSIYPWNEKLSMTTGYKARELKECVYALHDLQWNKRRSSLRFIRDKYKQDTFKCVSTLLSCEHIPHDWEERL